MPYASHVDVRVVPDVRTVRGVRSVSEYRTVTRALRTTKRHAKLDSRPPPRRAAHSCSSLLGKFGRNFRAHLRWRHADSAQEDPGVRRNS